MSTAMAIRKEDLAPAYKFSHPQISVRLLSTSRAASTFIIIFHLMIGRS